ncbi:MAG: hypothetical protein ABI353_11480 [Isosphaeraceae bacterium]
MARLGSALGAAVSAFRKAFFNTVDDLETVDLFSTLAARRLRYALFEAMWRNDAYDDVGAGNLFSAKFKADNGVYKYTQGVFNACHRLVETQATLIMGGILDPDAGDGTSRQSCLPVLDAPDGLRVAIAKTWASSNLQNEKVVWTRRGSMLGDAPLLVVDDVATSSVYLKSIHPRTLAELTKDAFGNVKGYVIEEIRDDPRLPPRTIQQIGMNRPTVQYLEVCDRVPVFGGFRVRHRTFLNGMPWDWKGNGAFDPEWVMDYDFVPMVFVPHIDYGGKFGLAEYHAGLKKAIPLDDVGSKINDQIRVLTQPKGFFSGMTASDLSAMDRRAADPTSKPQAGREQITTFFASEPTARWQAMVADMKIGECSAHLQTVLESHLADYPELRHDRVRSSGAAAAEAIREARKPAEVKILERRAPYLAALERATKMAVSIGGHNHAVGLSGYDAYAGFDLESFHTGDLGFSFDQTPVFAADVMDRITEEAAEAGAVRAWTDTGVPLAVALRRVGWTEEEVDETVALAKKEQADMEALLIERQAQLTAVTQPIPLPMEAE